MIFKIAERIAKLNRNELSPIEKEYEEDTKSLLSKVENVARRLRTGSLNIFDKPLEIDLEKSQKDSYRLVIRLPKELRIHNRNNVDMKVKFLDMRDFIWGLLHRECVKHEKDSGLKIYRINDENEHDDRDHIGFYYIFEFSLKPLIGYHFINDRFQGLW
jgi:hypothetical protein